MKNMFEKALGWGVTGGFLFGVYSIAHYVFKADDGTILVFAGFLLWSDMANSVNKPDRASLQPSQ